MADIVINYTYMAQQVEKLQELAAQYKAKGKAFNTAYNAATADWTGATKDAMKKFVDTTVKNYMEESVPGVLNGLANLLDANINQFSNADAQIASNIPGGQQG
jgi:hypothetical protein